MKYQFKYALRQGLSLRLTALAIMISVNLASMVFGYFGFFNDAILTAAVVLASLTCTAVFVTCVIADVAGFQDVFKSPDGYLGALAPVKMKTALFARTATAVLSDYVSLCAGVACITLHALIMSGDIGAGKGLGGLNLNVASMFGYLGLFLLGYTFILVLIVFSVTLKNTVFFGLRGRSWLSLLATAAAFWVLDLMNFTLAPLGTMERWGVFFTIHLPSGLGAGLILYLSYKIVQIAALFAASCALLERRMNLS